MDRRLPSVVVAMAATAALVVCVGASGRAEDGAAKSGWVGVQFRYLNRTEKVKAGKFGAAVTAVSTVGPAFEAGIRPEDIIVKVDGEIVEDAKAFDALLRTLPPGKKIRVDFRRHFRMELHVELTTISKDPASISARMQERAVAALIALQSEDGSWPDPMLLEEKASPPLTALNVRALAELPAKMRSGDAIAAALERGLDALERATDDRGAVAYPGRVTGYKNYATANTLVALIALGGEENALWRDRLRDHLLDAQIDGGEGFSKLDFQYGGWNYLDRNDRTTTRTDTSVGSWVVDALARAGVDAESKTFKRARRFFPTCQNFQSGNVIPGGVVRDGGFSFTPRESKAGQLPQPNGNVIYPSYGSASADGLRTLLNLGMPADDPRVVAAAGWFRNNWSLTRNPGFPEDTELPYEEAIYFYYLHGLARGLDALGEHPFETADGKKREWARDMILALAFRQLDGGLFRNEEPTMGEDEPTIATPLALMCLQTCDRVLAREAASSGD